MINQNESIEKEINQVGSKRTPISFSASFLQFIGSYAFRISKEIHVLLMKFS